MPETPLPASMEQLIAEVARALSGRPKLARMFARCFPNTLQTTITRLPDGTAFVITGDIPAMWLRDSAAQVRPYLALAARDPAIADLLAGVARRQIDYILHDPYANAFNQAPNRSGHQSDLTEMSPLVWERKYEVDSLCYPIQLAHLLWKATGRRDHLGEPFRRAAQAIVALWRREQRHPAASPYRFERPNAIPTDTLSHGGHGAPVAETGMTWSGFRPSDDSCTYGYLVPSNMFAVVALGALAELAERVFGDEGLAQQARQLRAEIDAGIQAFARYEHPRHGTIYAYETDGLGNYNLMDDANIPSLLSLPYLGYCAKDDPIYLNTRRFVLSADNPYFYQGTVAAGVGSPHTPPGYIWHLALAMQGLTAAERAEQEHILDLLERTDADTELMHEGFDAGDPRRFTRPWFAWANSLFSELVLAYCGLDASAT